MTAMIVEILTMILFDSKQPRNMRVPEAPGGGGIETSIKFKSMQRCDQLDRNLSYLREIATGGFLFEIRWT